MRSLSLGFVALMTTTALADPSPKSKDDRAQAAALTELLERSDAGNDPDNTPACTCDAPTDLEQQIRDADTFTAKIFQGALNNRKLVLDPGEEITLSPGDHVEAVDNGAVATIRRGARELHVRVYDDLYKRPELVRDEHRELHALVRAESVTQQRHYWRCGRPEAAASAMTGRPIRRVGQVVDGLGAAITLRYTAHHVTASYCAKPH